MRVPRLLSSLAAALFVLAVLAGTAGAQPRQAVVRPSALRERAGELQLPARITIAGRERIDTVASDRNLVLRPGDILVAKSADSATAAPASIVIKSAPPADDRQVFRQQSPGPAPAPPPARDTTSIALPYTLATSDSSTASGVRWLQARVEVVGGGFRYDPTQNAYVGKILIGIIDRDRPGQRIVLADTIFVQVTGVVDDVPPIALLRTSVPFQPVSLRTSVPDGPTVSIKVIPSFDPEGTVVTVPVNRAAVVVRVSPRHIAGLGLEKADVIIEPPFAAGTFPLSITAARGKADPSRVEVGPSGALVHVRSRGVGDDTLSVAGGVFSGEVVIVYDTPWLIAVCVLLGGALGGVLRGLAGRRLPTARKWRVLAAQGILTGLGVSVLYVIGIKAFAWAPDGQFGEPIMFILSFLGGLAGPRVFQRFVGSDDAGSGDGKKTEEEKQPEPAPAGV